MNNTKTYPLNNEELHELLVKTNSLLHVSSTGAGPTLQQKLWQNPGASKYLVGFFTPYARTQLHSFLGHPPEESYVCEDVAYDLAMASYIRASEHKVEAKLDGDPAGVGITAAVASDHMPRGLHRAFICVITKQGVFAEEVSLEKATGKDARLSHDTLLAEKAMGILSWAVDTVPMDGDLVDQLEMNHTKALERFYRYPVFKTNGTRWPRTSGGEKCIYLPATLNPIHDGHRAMCEAAEEELSPRVGRIKASYLVSSSSPHKGKLSIQEMLFKAGMLRAERWKGQSRSVEFTHDEPLFIDKARKRPGSVFLIGADTMARMLEEKWYESKAALDDSLREMSNLHTKFLVMERLVEGKVVGCRDIKVPWPHGNLFEPFGRRVDVSSTDLRRAAE